MTNKYRKRPIEVEAIQLNPWDEACIREFCPEIDFYPFERDSMWAVNTLEGRMFTAACNYLVKGIKGEFYFVKKEIFEASYELAGGEE